MFWCTLTLNNFLIPRIRYIATFNTGLKILETLKASTIYAFALQPKFNLPTNKNLKPKTVKDIISAVERTILIKIKRG